MSEGQFDIYKKLIMDQITRLNVLSSTQLSLNIMSATNPHTFKKEEFDIALNSLLESGEIVLLCFTNPNSNGTRSLYFPKDTEFVAHRIARVRPYNEVKEEWKEKYGLEP